MAPSQVYLGFWIDHVRGPILGSTLTTTARSGNLRIAFVALFISVVGSSLWNLLRFLVHQVRSTAEPRDALHHQQQAVLANSTTATGAALKLVFLPSTWKDKVENVYRRSMGLAALALIQVTMIICAGLFSSRIAQSSNGFVLISGDNCSTFTQAVQTDILNHDSSLDFNISDPKGVLQQMAEAWGRDKLFSSVPYARSCYLSGLEDTSAAGTCGYYVTPFLNWTIDYVPCPFGGDLCNTAVNGSVRIASVIDTALDLGVNTKYEDRLIYHKSATCAPLRPQISQCHPEKHSWGTDCITAYFYGNPNDGNGDTGGLSAWISSALPDVTIPFGVPYLVGSRGYIPGLGKGNNWNASQELASPNADTTLLGLSNGVSYNAPVLDPLFSATTEQSFGNGYPITGYVADHPVSFIACHQDYKVCTATGQCTESFGIFGLGSAIALPMFNEVQQSLVALIFTTDNTWFKTIWDYLRSQSLRASDGVWQSTSAALPDAQWVTEITYWWQIASAYFQRTLASQATGEGNDLYRSAMARPTLVQGGLLCSMQKVRRPDYYSFSVLGLGIVLSIGITTIILDLGLKATVGRDHHKNSPRRLEWLQTGFLRMQRRTFPNEGKGRWSRQLYQSPSTSSSSATDSQLGYDKPSEDIEKDAAVTVTPPTSPTSPVSTLLGSD